MKAIKYLLIALLLGGSTLVWAQTEEPQESNDIYELSLEDLLGMTITSVSKKEERLQDVASSIYVLNADVIAKSGATNLHELLRLVPGYWGTQREYNTVDPSVRNSKTVNDINGTVLYLLDGTPIQDLMSSSFSFRNFDIPLDEIERIEFIRGSGGTIYGANSATGVINIFTKTPDNYDGINAKVTGAAPGFIATSLRAGGQINDRIAISGYGKMRSFGGFDSFAGKDLEGNNITTANRFTNDYEKTLMFSTGLKGIFELNEKGKISLNAHYNTLEKIDYTNAYESDALDLFTQTIQRDQLFENEVNASRLVGNLRFDYNFNENHSLFVRVSSNAENDLNTLGGGFHVSNSIIDLEVQDNIQIGSSNALSFGVNFRQLNFDIHDINSATTIGFIDPQATESIKGSFVQNKTSLLDGKLNFIYGVKAEANSLIAGKAYFSPMAKFSVIPTEKITIWGGYTQSFTTPGFNNTNIDLFLFQAPSRSTWVEVVSQAVFQQIYEQNISAGFSEADAAALAQVAVDASGAMIAAEAANLESQNPSFAVKNGTETVPQKFQALELGIRANPASWVYAETSLFYNMISDGIDVMDIDAVAEFTESITQGDRSAIYYLYGNYVMGTSKGAESMIRFIPAENLNIELSHTWLSSSWEFQENNDFDIYDTDLISNTDRTPSTPLMPEHVFRFTGSANLSGFNVSLSSIYTSIFRTSNAYRFEDQRFENIIGSRFESSESTGISPDQNRFILNLRIQKSIMNEKLSFALFGNDVTNSGNIVGSDFTKARAVTVSQIGAMFGASVNYNF
jgi:outer membrane receptor for ferrienterochelin and colicin